MATHTLGPCNLISVPESPTAQEGVLIEVSGVSLPYCYWIHGDVVWDLADIPEVPARSLPTDLFTNNNFRSLLTPLSKAMAQLLGPWQYRRLQQIRHGSSGEPGQNLLAA